MAGDRTGCAQASDPCPEADADAIGKQHEASGLARAAEKLVHYNQVECRISVFTELD